MIVRPFYGWKLLAAFWLLLLITSSFTLYGGSVINARMAMDFGTDPSYRGLPTSIYQMMFGLGALVVAILVNRWGVRMTLACGSGLMVAGAVLMACVVTRPMSAALAYGLVLGASAAAGGGIATQAGVARWFRGRRALAMAILFSAPGVGGFFVAPLMRRVIEMADGNWRVAWWVVAAVGIVAVWLALAAVIEDPADIGQVPDGAAPGTDVNAGLAAKSSAFITSETWTRSEVLRSPGLWVMLVAFIGVNMGFTLNFAVGIDHLKELGHTMTAGTWALAFFGISALLGKVALGIFGDRFDPRYVWAVTIAGFAVGLFLIGDARSNFMLKAYPIFLGFGWGGGIACMMSVLSNYYGPRIFPSIAGLAVAVTTCAGALAPMPFAAGRLHALFGSYTPVFRGLAVWCLIGAVAMLLVRRPARGPS